MGKASDDAFLDGGELAADSAIEAARQLVREAVASPRLPGGATESEVERLLTGVSIRLEAEEEKAMPPAQSDAYSARLERAWEIEGPPLTLKTVDDPRRRDVVARFCSLVFARRIKRDLAARWWFVSGYLALDATGELGVAHLVVEPERPGVIVTPNALRELSVSKIIARARHVIAHGPEFLASAERLGLVAPDEAARSSAAASAARIQDVPPRRRGRPPLYTDMYYFLLARDYLDLLGRGVTRGLHAALAARVEERTGQRLSPATVRSQIRRCRSHKIGFLRGAKHGRAGAAPGPRYHEFAAKEQSESR
jgi:hypothetical protein